jgi:glycosyltransferase involved in cell wall biosynthesis
MNVLMIGLYPPHVGGVSSYVYSLKNALEKRGITVYVVTYGKSPGVYGAPVTPRLRGVSFCVTGTQKVLQVIRKRPCDILHAHYLVPPGLVGVLAKKVSRIPLVVTCHGSDVLVASGFIKVLSNYVVRVADCVVCNSDAVLKRVHTDTPTRVIPSGVNTNRFKPLQMDRKSVTYVGSLHKVKGVDIFLRALKGIDVPVWVVGDGPERKSLEELAHSLGIDCTFWGPRTDIPELMNQSKIVVLPSRHEGFGLTLLEAMACKTPVIGRTIGGIPELLTGENGLLFTTEEELHQHVETLLHDHSLWEKLQKNGFETALQWGWDKTAALYEDVYNLLLH